MIEFEVSQEIARPVDEVFAFITAPENDRLWKAAVREAHPSDGPMRPGATWRQVVAAPGGRTETVEECTAYTRNETFAQRCPAPFEHGATMTFAPTAAGTRLDVAGYVELKGAWKLLRPLIARVINRSARTDAARLKAVLEAETAW